jgi:WD40 repeat protein
MSILEKPLTPQPHRSKRRLTIIILSIVAVLLIALFVFTDIHADLAFVVHFATAPNHFTYQGHSDYVSAVAWSPDGKRIASASGDHTVQVWDALTGNNAYTYRGHVDFYWGHFTSNASVNAVAWSPDGKRIASSSNDSTVQVWQAK